MQSLWNFFARLLVTHKGNMLLFFHVREVFTSVMDQNGLLRQDKTRGHRFE